MTRVSTSGVHSPRRDRLCGSREKHTTISSSRASTRFRPTVCQEAIMRSIDSKSLMIHDRGEERSMPAMIVCWTGVLSLLFAFSVPLHAQFGASLSGTVLDPTGAAISKATVTLMNPATQVKQISITNDTGAYHFNELAPGQYTLEVEAQGFGTHNVTDLALAAETPRSMDVTLQAGRASESVQV